MRRPTVILAAVPALVLALMGTGVAATQPDPGVRPGTLDGFIAGTGLAPDIPTSP